MIRAFEIIIYNRVVRSLVENGQHHADLSDDWADHHYIEVEAENAMQAREKILRRYPEKNGYVIVEVQALKEFQ